MMQRDERHGLRLYVKRVFIMDAAEQLLPHYLRFIRGVVDSDVFCLSVCEMETGGAQSSPGMVVGAGCHWPGT